MKLDPKEFLNKIKDFFENLFATIKTKFTKKSNQSDINEDDVNNIISDDDIDSLLNSAEGEKKTNKFVEKLKDLFYENKVISIVFLSLIVLLLILVIILLAISSKVSNTDDISDKIEKLELNYNYTMPYEDVINSYSYSRELKDSWTAEESEKWFAVPQGETLKSLEDKNTDNIYKILESAP